MLVWTLIHLGCCINSCAMIGLIGVETDAEQWKHVAVIYAEVLATKQQDDRPSHWTLRLRPIATLTGNVDAAQLEEIEANATIANMIVSYIQTVPATGTKVIALLGGVVNC